MNKEQITAEIKKALTELFSIDEAKLQPQATLREDIGLDSIDVFDLLARLEEVTGLILSADDLKGVTTLSDLIDTICTHLANRPAQASV